MLIELHVLQNHSPSNLNRDEDGSPKTAVFGGVPRARISSQCLKRSIRRSEIFQNADFELSTRTRRLPVLVRDGLMERGYSKELADLGAAKASGFGNKEGTEQKADTDTGDFATAQTMLLSDADIAAVTDAIAARFEELGKDPKRIKKELKIKDMQKDEALARFRAITVDTALFGRMITSDVFRDVDASMQVAHAISTHRVEGEYDYFTAVDDLQDGASDDKAGADMIGDVEFNSACYYKYFSLDVGELAANLSGERPYGHSPSSEEKEFARLTARKAVEAFIRAAVMVTPSGKQNTFAAHQLPSLVLAEIRPSNTPISYANAFVKPVSQRNGENIVEVSIQELSAHAGKLSKAFNLKSNARLYLEPTSDVFELKGANRVADLETLIGKISENLDG